MSSSNAQHVSYEEAMSSLQSMMPHLDSKLIAQTLQQNRGHLERTVEELLSLPDDASASALNFSSSSSSSSTHQRRRSSVAPPSVGGSNLPDDFLRQPSWFSSRYGEGGAQSQIDQDAILAQMLQDEMFMAEIRANPELYSEEPAHPVHAAHVPQAQAATSSYVPPHHSSATVPSSHTHSSSSSHAPIVSSARGDFSGVGSSNIVHASSASFRDRWNGLTSAAKKRLLTVAGMMRTTPATSSSTSLSSSSPHDHPLKGDLSSSLLSDSDPVLDGPPLRDDDSTLLTGSSRTSDTVRERDVTPAVREIGEGVYIARDSEDTGDLSEESSSNSSYQPPNSSILNQAGPRRWGKLG